MENTDLIIVTSTYYPSGSTVEKVRADISKKTIKSAVDHGYEILIVDSGSSEDLLNEYKSFGARIHASTAPTMGAARREGIALALKEDKKYIAWTEPEKDSFIPEISKTLPSLLEGADMVIPKRKSLSSYPEFQQYTEKVGNLFWLELTNVDIDIYFGTRVWKKEFSSYFLNYKGEYGDRWDSTFIPVMDAVLDNIKMVSIEVDYVNPPEQTAIEKQDIELYRKRLEQLNALSNAFDTHWRKNHRS